MRFSEKSSFYRTHEHNDVFLQQLFRLCDEGGCLKLACFTEFQLVRGESGELEGLLRGLAESREECETRWLPWMRLTTSVPTLPTATGTGPQKAPTSLAQPGTGLDAPGCTLLFTPFLRSLISLLLQLHFGFLSLFLLSSHFRPFSPLNFSTTTSHVWTPREALFVPTLNNPAWKKLRD